MIRQKEMEEREYLEALFENNEYTYETELNEKLYAKFKEHFRTKVLRNDENDLLTHHTFVMNSPAPYISETEARKSSEPRNL